MLEKLKKKWKVSGTQLLLILCVFAITGTATAYISKAITGWVGLTPQSPLLWRASLRAVILIFGYQVIILLVSIPFGQFSFFFNYEKKILRRLGLLKKIPQTATDDLQPIGTNIAIFASGAGSNAQKIIDYFKTAGSNIKVALIVSNKPAAGVLQIAAKENIPALIIEKEKFFTGNAYVDELKEQQIDFIVLAGFLWKVPAALINAYPKKIINIHPALLPKYGGKGMYGHFVHAAVIANKEKESGITIHYVDELYDHGLIIFQTSFLLNKNETAETLAARIHELEHRHFPQVVEEAIKGKGNILTPFERVL
jgi:formyltetrahydrofolate-dependent phosphoribosylglycinamide formyltransferase